MVYLRNPSEIANSLYSTSIKSGLTRASPSPPKHEYFSNICNHKDTLEKFTTVFGKPALIPRIFHKLEFKDGEIINDFLEVVGLPNNGEYNVPHNQNEALSISAIEILRRINERIPRFINNKPNPLHAYIVSYLETNFTGNKYIMPKLLYKEYDENFRESNEWVRKHYFPEKKFLFPPSEYLQETDISISSNELDWIADIICQAWIYTTGHISTQSIIQRIVIKIQLRVIPYLCRFPKLISKFYKLNKTISVIKKQTKTND